MSVVAIVQARMGSTRLPGKVLQDIGGRTMLARVVCRTQQAASLDELVVATTVRGSDEAIVAECRELDVPVFRGEEDDVLDRYYQAGHSFRAQAVVRITSDCPLIDPGVIDKVVGTFLEAKPDYASNTLERTYPRGLDTEVMSVSALERAWQEATKSFQRVHVTPYLYQNPDRFRLVSVTNERDLSEHRWTVDTREDLDFVREIYERFGNEDGFSWVDVLDLLVREPALVELNRAVRQKALHEG
jgi:spore coat polysaccharide biosynthesis protein SpsF